LANHKSALKRARQNAVRRLRNKSVKSRVKTVVSDIHQAIAEGNTQVAAEKLNQAQSVIDKASKKGVIHTRTASRKISRLSRKINAR
jgi:small subunit ribosomal protein S20